MLPAASVTVYVAVLVPAFAVLGASTLTLALTSPSLLSIAEAIYALKSTFSPALTVIEDFVKLITGADKSLTTTFKLASLTFPELSVAEISMFAFHQFLKYQ